MVLLEFKGIEVNYGSISALESISLRVEEGEIITLIGSNGTGKNITMRTIVGLKENGKGTITFDGGGTTNKDTKVMVSQGITLSPEERQVFPKFTVLDDLKSGAYSRSDAEIEESLKTVYQLFPKLLARKEQMAGTLSDGEQQVLAAGRTMMGRPKLLLLDESSLRLALLAIKKIFEMILQVRGMGATILLVEQSARVALKHSDRAYVLETGKVVLEDTTGNLLNSDEVRRAYLGGI